MNPADTPAPDFATALALLQLARPSAPTVDESTVEALLRRPRAVVPLPHVAPPEDPHAP
jgi:hypothetical protein